MDFGNLIKIIIFIINFIVVAVCITSIKNVSILLEPRDYRSECSRYLNYIALSFILSALIMLLFSIFIGFSVFKAEIITMSVLSAGILIVTFIFIPYKFN
jgi:hypothetical protein